MMGPVKSCRLTWWAPMSAAINGWRVIGSCLHRQTGTPIDQGGWTDSGRDERLRPLVIMTDGTGRDVRPLTHAIVHLTPRVPSVIRPVTGQFRRAACHIKCGVARLLRSPLIRVGSARRWPPNPPHVVTRRGGRGSPTPSHMREWLLPCLGPGPGLETPGPYYRQAGNNFYNFFHFYVLCMMLLLLKYQSNNSENIQKYPKELW